MANGYVLFEDATRELNMSEEELKKLMEEGKIRHFMDGGKVKFRRNDLDNLKATLGIAEAEEEETEITLAPPDELPPVPEAEEVPPPPPAVELGAEAEIAIEPLEEEPGVAVAAMAAAGAVGREEVGAEEPEEIASLSEFEIGEEVEEEGEEISEEEAQLLSMETPGFRTYQEPEAASVGITVALVLIIIVVAFGVVTLLSFVMGHNPLSGLTDVFVK